MASRGRWKGSCKQLGDALREGVTEPTDLQYDGNPKKAVFSKQLLFAAPMRKLIQNLHALHARMNFKKDVQGALLRIYASHSEWPQTEEARRDYQHHVSPKVLNAIQNFETAHVRKKPAKWTTELLRTATKEETALISDMPDGEQ